MRTRAGRGKRLRDPDAARRLGTAARAHAESRTWEGVLDGLLGHYADVLERGPLARPA